jgi:hypothetical protein
VIGESERFRDGTNVWSSPLQGSGGLNDSGDNTAPRAVDVSVRRENIIVVTVFFFFPPCIISNVRRKEKNTMTRLKDELICF